MSNDERATATLLNALSADRFGTYLRAAGSPERALDLYEWNATVSAAVMHLTGLIEVPVRNAMDRSLSDWHSRRSSGEWWDAAGRLDHRGTRDVDDAKRRANNVATHGKIVAELNFGFWRYLTTRRYLTAFWIPALDHGFAAPGSSPARRRAWVEQRLKNLQFVRNRAAHHEPLFVRDLARDVAMAFELADAIHSEVGDWVRSQCTVRDVLALKPEITGGPGTV